MATVLLTGCSSGFGLRASLLFARQGHTVFATMRDVGKAKPLTDAADTEGLALHVLPLDVTDDASVHAAVDEVLARAGRLDIVVNNAGIELRGPVELVSDAEMLAQFDTNVFGVVRVLRAVLPVMRAQGAGVIVNVSSIAGLVARPFGGLYAASKHALEAISEAVHLEGGEFGIRVAIVEPGQFETALAANAIDAEAFTPSSPYWELSQRFDEALGRLLPGDERPDADVVAETIVQVAEDESAPLRHLVGTDAELIWSVRRAGDFESYEKIMREALDWH